MAARATRLRILPPEPDKWKDRTATHEMPSGLGGVFPVEVLRRDGDMAEVRIHSPRTEWHHWQGVMRVPVSSLKEFAP